MDKPRKPVRIDAQKLAPAPAPQEVAPVPEPENRSAMGRAALLATRRGGWLGRLFWGAIFALFSLSISLATWDFVEAVLLRNIWLGRAVLALTGIVVLVLVLGLLRELVGLHRLRRLDDLRQKSVQARGQSRDAALGTLAELDRFYQGRPDLRWARAALKEQKDDIFDAAALLDLAEKNLMNPLDAAAVLEIEAAARKVAAATALVPLALVDILVALTSNMAMIRRIATLYGGRAGGIGSWRLFKGVASHLLATGAMAVGEDMVGSLVGGGAISKVSRRFGEGVINGTLTARVGVAAMEVCRPMPFVVRARPRASVIVKSALLGLFKSG